ncbi:MAG: hypothetical protein LC640_08910 [Frankia sp.]|nr:hypothetical protein [Frankia sp.]
MNAADLLRRRLDEQAAIREAVLAEFEVTDSRSDRLRRMVVVVSVAQRLGVKPFNWRFVGRVSRVVQELGAEPIIPFNRRMWRKLRRRG